MRMLIVFTAVLQFTLGCAEAVPPDQTPKASNSSYEAYYKTTWDKDGYAYLYLAHLSNGRIETFTYRLEDHIFFYSGVFRRQTGTFGVAGENIVIVWDYETCNAKGQEVRTLNEFTGLERLNTPSLGEWLKEAKIVQGPEDIDCDFLP